MKTDVATSSTRRATLLHALLLSALCVGVYANGFHHAFNLDSGYGLVDNPFVRSLEHTPRYFTDPFTLTTYRANADYRPVLQLTFALNYAVSGYEMWSWHLVQILLHIVCSISLYLLCRELLERFHSSLTSRARARISLTAAAIFAVHPANSGVVSYLWARSSLLVAAFLLPSFVLYLRARFEGDRRGARWLAFLLYVLALFSKVEAIAALGVYVLCEVLAGAWRRMASNASADDDRNLPSSPARAKGGFLRDLLRAANLGTLRRLAPFLVATAAYAVVRHLVVPEFAADARHSANVSHGAYLLTQLTAWWYYLYRWFAPVSLVADYLAYPVYRSLFELPVLLALGGWLGVALVCWVSYRGAPWVTFLVVAALAIISPTSSVMPLAEMVNEHRPYLPMGILSLTWTIGAGTGLVALSRRRGGIVWTVAVPLLGACLGALGLATWERNQVFETRAGYWADVNAKAPSARSHLNAGVELMRENQLEAAQAELEAALALAPNWHITHINLGLVHQAQGNQALALQHFTHAVQTDLYTSRALIYRARFYLETERYGLAARDLEASLDRAMEADRFEIYHFLAKAYAGLGDAEQALAYTRACWTLDPARMEGSIVDISRPFYSAPERYQAGIVYYRGVAELLPERWWIYQNIGSLARQAGREAVAAEAFRRADALRDEHGPEAWETGAGDQRETPR